MLPLSVRPVETNAQFLCQFKMYLYIITTLFIHHSALAYGYTTVDDWNVDFESD